MNVDEGRDCLNGCGVLRMFDKVALAGLVLRVPFESRTCHVSLILAGQKGGGRVHVECRIIGSTTRSIRVNRVGVKASEACVPKLLGWVCCICMVHAIHCEKLRCWQVLMEDLQIDCPTGSQTESSKDSPPEKLLNTADGLFGRS